MRKEVVGSIWEPNVKVVMESQVEAHDERLYRASDVHAAGAEAASVVEDYDRYGFVVARGLYDDAEVEAARAELHEMTRSDAPRCDSIYFEGAIRERLGVAGGATRAAGENPRFSELALGSTDERMPAMPGDERARYVRKFMGFSSHHPPLLRLAEKPELVALVERLARARVCMFQDMAMIKPPGGREKPWHQDHAYFNLPLDARVVGVWIALDRVTPENGCMHVIPGGHRAGPRTHFMRRDWQLCDAEMLGVACTAVPMEAGDALLFDAKLPHGTPTNKTPEFRWAVQLHYRPRDVPEVSEDVRLNAFGSEGKNVTC